MSSEFNLQQYLEEWESNSSASEELRKKQSSHYSYLYWVYRCQKCSQLIPDNDRSAYHTNHDYYHKKCALLSLKQTLGYLEKDLRELPKKISNMKALIKNLETIGFVPTYEI
jgi:hypothetical protein